MPRFARGPDVGQFVKAGPAPADPAAPAAPAGPVALVDQLVTVKGMVPAPADGSKPDAVRLTLGALDPTSPAPIVAVHAIVSPTPLDAGLTAEQLLATPGVLSGSTQVGAGAPGTDIDVPVAGVPVGTSFWYTVLEYAA
jgi:hypothetical protein